MPVGRGVLDLGFMVWHTATSDHPHDLTAHDQLFGDLLTCAQPTVVCLGRPCLHYKTGESTVMYQKVMIMSCQMCCIREL